MVGLVLVACKIVEKYDKNDSLVELFSSCNERYEKDGVSEYIIHKYNSKDKLYNGFYYSIIQPKPYYVKATCDYCGNEFKCERFRTEGTRTNLFCSKKCEADFKKSHTVLNCICEVCGKPYHVKQSRIDSSKYCSRACQNKAKETYMKGRGNHQYGLKGDKNASWKSDERISYYGYKMVRMPDHPFKNCDDFVFEHRLIAEKYLLNDDNSTVVNDKKYLSPDFVAHHIDFNRLNNNKDNIIVMSKKEHSILHSKIRKSNNALIEYCNKYNLDIDIIMRRMNESKKYKKN